MGFERQHRLDREPYRRPDRTPAEPAPPAHVPGRRTCVEQLLARLPAPDLLELDDYRVLALRGVLGALGRIPELHDATIALADREVARRALPALRPSSPAPQPPATEAAAAGGRAMWRVADRRAATLYRRARDGGEASPDDPAVEAALARAGSGAPLAAGVRRTMEDALGVSLARVRVHTDEIAAAAARAVHAEAFTVGEDIFFAEGAFAPESRAGRRLLAHELAHVVQGWEGRAGRGGAGVRVSRPDDSLEQEADAITERLARGTPGPAPNDTGLPGALKAGLEALSGMSLDHVRVHYDSARPAELNAHAYAHGSEIHVGPGQEQHLPHEAWHVVQQAQGRVAPTAQAAGVAVSDDVQLEREADEMGARALEGGAALAGGGAPGAPSARPAGAPAAVVQGKFKRKDGEPGLWIDDQTGQTYRLIYRAAGHGLFERVRDHFRVRVRVADRLPIDDDDESRARRLDTGAGGTSEPAADDEVDLEVEPTFTKVTAPITPPFVKPRDPMGKAAHPDKKPSQFTTDLVVAPLVKGEPKKLYRADELLVVSAAISNERPPTRHQNRTGEGDPKRRRTGGKKKKGQRSHTAAFVLIRDALKAFQGRLLVDLIDFMNRGVQDLAGEHELEPEAKRLARPLTPGDDLEDAEDGEARPTFLASLEDAELPLSAWNTVASQGLRAYEVAHHKSAAAAYADGEAKPHGEKDRHQRLHQAEVHLRDHPDATLNKIYRKDKRAIDDAIGLLDAKHTLSLPPMQWVRAARHWFELLYVAYPAVMAQIGADLKEEYFGRALPKGRARDTGCKTTGEMVKKLSGGEPEDPAYGLPRAAPKLKYDVGGMSKATAAAHVRLDPRHVEHDGVEVPPHAELTIDELVIHSIQIGEARLPTQFANQRSHTVAWTLVRAGLAGFRGQPFVDLCAFLRHAAGELADDFNKTGTGKAEAGQAGADAAAALVSTLGQLMNEKLPLEDWQRYAPNLVIEYLRLDQLSRSATYNKEEKPPGHAEPHHMQVLRENEAHLQAYGGLYDDPGVVCASATALLDAEFHAALSWKRMARAVIRWQQALWNAFPALMGLGGGAIVASVHGRALPPRASWGTTRPAADAAGAPINTVGDLVRHVRVGDGTLPPTVEDTVTLAGPCLSTGAHTRFHARHTVAGRDSLYASFALGLIGLVSQGSLDRGHVAARLPGVEAELLAELIQLGERDRNPSSARAIQLALGPELRRAAAAAVDQSASPRAEVAELCRVELTRLVKTPNAPSAVPPSSPLADAKAPVMVEMQRVAAELAAAGDLEGASLDDRIAAWARDAGVAGYVRRLADPEAGGDNLELRALAYYFGVEAVQVFDADCGTDRWRTDAAVRPSPIADTGLEAAELHQLAEAGAILGDRGDGVVRFPRLWPEDIDKLAIDDGLRERYRALVSGGRMPTLGVHRSKDGRWRTLATAAGAFDLQSNADHLGAGADHASWRSEAMPEAVEHRVVDESGARIARAPTEGTFTTGGAKRVVWKTEGDHNCAFNAMALAVVGLIVQRKLDQGALAATTGLDEALLGDLAGDAAKIQTHAEAARRIEAALAGPLRALAVAAVRARPHLVERLADELTAELRGRVYLALGLPFDRFSDLFVDRMSPVIARLTERADDVVAQLAEAVAGTDLQARAKIVDAAFHEQRAWFDAWSRGEGAEAYLAGLAQDRVWAGTLELHGLAEALGISLVTFTDIGGGVYARDAGTGTSGAAPRGALSDADVEELRRRDVIEGGRAAGETATLLFQRLSRDQVVDRLAGDDELAARFLPIYDEHYRGSPGTEVGLFRHRHRAHWSAVTTDLGGYDLGDRGDYLDGRQVLDRPVDGRGPAGSGGGAHRSYRPARPRGPVEGRFTSARTQHVVWKTEGDHNCAFNSMALSVMGLVAQGKLTVEALGTAGLDVATVNALADDAKRIQTDPAAAVRIQETLAGPLRSLAVAAVRAQPRAVDRLTDELKAELRGRVYTALGLRFDRYSDLFVDTGSPVVAALVREADAAFARVLSRTDESAGAPARRAATDAEVDAPGVDAWCRGEGAEAYLAGLAQDRVWAGTLELHALATALGVQLVTLTDVGRGIVSRDAGVEHAGSAPRDTLSDAEVEELRRRNVIEGGGPASETRRICFMRLTGEQVAGKLAGDDALADRFMPLYKEHYPYHDAAPVEVGLFRHRYAHWSTVTTATGGYDLNDPTDHLGGRALPSHAVDAGAWHYELAPTSVPASSGGATSAAAVTFQRTKLAVPDVETAYTDYTIGERPFAPADLDPTHDPSHKLALVNAANAGLRGGGGLDGAILAAEGAGSRAAELDARGIGSIKVGQAVTTSGGDLSKQGVAGVIHTVGPRDGDTRPWDDLRACVRSVLDEAAVAGFGVLMMTNASSELFGLPKEQTGTIIRDELERLLGSPPPEWGGWMPRKIIFNRFPKDTPITTAAAAAADPTPGDHAGGGGGGAGRTREERAAPPPEAAKPMES